MNKKLILNKEVIAELDNPLKIVGGEGAPSVDTCTCPTLAGATCDGGKTCPIIVNTTLDIRCAGCDTTDPGTV